jgi:hypothetical protein
MIDYHNIENALLTLSFNYSTIRHASKVVDDWNTNNRHHWVPVVAGNVSLVRAPSGDCYVTIRQIADCGRFEDVTVYVPVTGASEDSYICERGVIARSGL